MRGAGPHRPSRSEVRSHAARRSIPDEVGEGTRSIGPTSPSFPSWMEATRVPRSRCARYDSQSMSLRSSFVGASPRARRARIGRALLGAFAGALLVLSSCPRAPSAPARRVILITCDTLRADRLGFDGYTRPTSPSLDAFAARCVAYDEAYTTIPITGPALSALHTGRLPDELGLAGGNKNLLGAPATTLAELARGAGMKTGAVVSNWVLRRPAPEQGDVGLQQGFAHYDDRMESREGARAMFERRAPETTDAAIEWLEACKRAGDDRVFLWVHYQDPHGPYVPPPEMLAGLERPSTGEPAPPIGRTQLGRGQIPMYQAVDGERDPERYRVRYDGEVRYFDAQFGRLIAWLETNGWYDDALIVFTSDHGESLGEHGFWFCHGENVFREEVRVPLLVKAPKSIAPPPARSSATVSHLDLWPTVLEALSVAGRENRGVSLLRGAPTSERACVQVVREPGSAARWSAVTDGRWRLVAEAGRPEALFDVGTDPAELHDLAAAQAAKVSELRTRGDEFTRRRAEPLIAPVPLLNSPETQRALRHTGYEGGDDH